MWKTLVCVCVCVCARITQNILLHQQETALERVAFSVLLGACAVQKLYTHTHATRNTTVNPTLISSTDMCVHVQCVLMQGSKKTHNDGANKLMSFVFSLLFS